jgi:hypothetical protein
VEQIVHIEPGDPDEAQDLAKALEIGKILERHYPNHPWVISFQSHALIIRHLPIANAVTMAAGKEGFGSVLPPNMVTAKNLNDEVVRFAGALLEAFQLPRGPWDGRDPIVPEELRKAAIAGRSLQ